MNDKLSLLSTDLKEDVLTKLNSIGLEEEISAPTITAEVMRFYANEATKMKDKIDQMAAEVNQRHDRIRLLNDIIAEINDLTDDKNGFEISELNTELRKKLKIAKELGVKIKDNQFKFNAIERDRLLDNLRLQGENWDKENRFQTQKIEIFVKELDRLMLLLKDTDRKEDQAKRSMISGIKG